MKTDSKEYARLLQHAGHTDLHSSNIPRKLINQNKRREIIYVTYMNPSKIVTSSMILVRNILVA